MKEFIKNLFSENTNVSCMRFMSVLSLFVGSIIAFTSLYRDCNLNQSSATIAIFIGAAFGGKVLQKSKESKQYKK